MKHLDGRHINPWWLVPAIEAVAGGVVGGAAAYALDDDVVSGAAGGAGVGLAISTFRSIPPAAAPIPAAGALAGIPWPPFPFPDPFPPVPPYPWPFPNPFPPFPDPFPLPFPIPFPILAATVHATDNITGPIGPNGAITALYARASGDGVIATNYGGNVYAVGSYGDGVIRGTTAIVSASTVPEPATVWLLGCGLLTACCARWRRLHVRRSA